MNRKNPKLGLIICGISSLILLTTQNLFSQESVNSRLEYDINQYIQDTKKYVVNVISGTNRTSDRQIRGKAVTGCIVDTHGIVITRKSVIDNMSYVYIKLNDGREMNATLIGIDEFYNFAILKTDPFNIDPPSFAQQNSEQIGNTVLIQANNLGYYPDHSFGLVENVLDDGVIQIVGTLWPGHNGAPVFNFNGQIVGILSVLLASGRKQEYPEIRVEKEGIVIPIVYLLPSIKKIILQASTGTPWLGMVLTELGSRIVKYSVTHITPGSPTEKAGIKLGDQILSYDDYELRSISDLKTKIMSMHPFENIKFVIKRQDSVFTKNISLGRMPSAFTLNQNELEVSSHKKSVSIFEKYPKKQVDRVLLQRRLIQIESQLNALKRSLKREAPE